jgi:hypothetical protein
MGTVINFPGHRLPNFQSVKEKIEKIDDNKPVDTSIFLEEEDSAFLSLLKEWPCFHNLEESINLQQLFEFYYDDELNPSQDCVLEFMFHMHDPDSCFDISNALYTWNEEDRQYFFTSLNMHAELIDIVRKEELS